MNETNQHLDSHKEKLQIIKGKRKDHKVNQTEK